VTHYYIIEIDNEMKVFQNGKIDFIFEMLLTQDFSPFHQFVLWCFTISSK